MRKKLEVILYVLLALLAVSVLLTSYRVYSYGGLDIILRVVIIVLLLALFGVISIMTYVSFKKKKTVKFFSFGLFAVLFLVLNLFAFFFLSKVKTTLDKISTKEESFVGVIVTLKDSKIKSVEDLKGKKVGYFDLKESFEGYIIPKDILQEAKVDSEVVYAPFEQLPYLANALYEGTIDAMMIGGNYVSLMESLPGFNDVGAKTKIIASKEEVKKVELNPEKTNEILKKPFSVLFMGVDTNKPSESGNLTGNADALFLVTVNPINYTINVTSIPRDSYVPIACYPGQTRDKITHSNVGGTDCVMKTVGNLFDVKIDYFIKINFKGLEDLVDALGGVYIFVDPEKYPDGLVAQNGKRYYEQGYKFVYIAPGLNKVKGELALAYARTRKNLEFGATERASNQTAVINAIIQQFLKLENFNKIFDVLDAMAKNVQTNFTTDQMVSFYKLGTDILSRGSKLNMNEAIVFDYYLLSGYDRNIYHDDMEMLLYQYVPFKTSIENIKHKIHQNLGLEPYQIVKDFKYYEGDNWIKDQAVFYYYNEAQESFPLPDLVPDMTGWNIDKARAWASERGISLIESPVREGESGYDPNLEHGFVLEHDQKINRKVSKISSITVKYIYNKEMLPEFNLSPSVTIQVDRLNELTIPAATITIDGKVDNNLSSSYKYRITDINKTQTYSSSKDLGVGEYRIVYSVQFKGKTYEASIPLYVVDKPAVTMSLTCPDKLPKGSQSHGCSVSFSDGSNNEVTYSTEPDLASAEANTSVKVTAHANVDGKDLSDSANINIVE